MNSHARLFMAPASPRSTALLYHSTALGRSCLTPRPLPSIDPNPNSADAKSLSAACCINSKAFFSFFFTPRPLRYMAPKLDNARAPGLGRLQLPPYSSDRSAPTQLTKY